MAANHRGKTALITGASGGIGEELAKVFAAHGFDLVLVARTETKLITLGDALSAQHNIRCTTIPADLALPESPAEVVAQLTKQEIRVDVLVNNAGFAAYGQFQEIDLDEQLHMIRVNIATLTELTHRLLPGMLARRRGKIMNVASTAAFMPGPLMAVYYATKAYVLSFSEALNSELSGTGVTVTALCPGPTNSGFQSRANMEDSRLARMRVSSGGGTTVKTVIVGMPVLRWAVAISPRHGLLNAVTGPRPKSIRRDSTPAATRTNAPSRRGDAPRGRSAITVSAVPRETPPTVSKASVSVVAPGSRRCRWAARQSDGTTPKPTPGRSMIPAALASPSRAAHASNSGTSPARSR
jgi:uncharacterized protein